MRRLSFGLIFVLSIVAAGAAGCEKDKSSGNFEGIRGVLSAVCAYLDRCPQDHFAFAYRSRGECVDIMEAVLTCRLTDDEVNDVHTWRLEEVEITADASEAAACIEWLNTADCDALASPDPTPCDSVLAYVDDGDDGGPDLAAEGESCEERNCEEGLHCLEPDAPDDGTDWCMICLPPSQEGEKCANPYRPCGESLLCNPDGVCEGPRSLGEPCADWQYCEEETFCDWDLDQCVPLLGENEPCLADSYCAEGLMCMPDTDVCEFPRSAGEPCTRDEYCETGFCHEGTDLCDPAGYEGDPCVIPFDCRSQICDASSMTCFEPRPNGEPCTENIHCQRYHCDPGTSLCGYPDGADCNNHSDCQSNFCHYSNDVCTPAVGIGEPCDYDEQCEGEARCDYQTDTCLAVCETNDDCRGADEYCDWDVCRAYLEDGAECWDDEECLSGWCNSNDRCAVKPDIGDPCTATWDCYPWGICDGNVCVEKKGPGESCVRVDGCLEPFLCIEGRCTMMNLQCSPAATGDMCAWLRVCEEGAYCDMMDNITCKPQKGEGGECFQSEECRDGLYCEFGVDGGTCAAYAGLGDDCTEAECDPQFWCDRNAVPFACAEKKAGGEVCDSDRECLSDSCFIDVCDPVEDPGPTCVMY